MTKRRKATGSFALAVSAADAIGLFTPEGERGWVPGWSPTYPSGAATEDPGTVFTTTADSVETTWVILGIDRAQHTSAYARITPGYHAGTVRVRCEDRGGAGSCVIFVEYDMTALSPDRASLLDQYDVQPFDAMMKDWAEAVGRYLDVVR